MNTVRKITGKEASLVSKEITKLIPNKLSFWGALTNKDIYKGESDIVTKSEVEFLHDNYRRLLADGYKPFEPDEDINSYIREYSNELLENINPTADKSASLQVLYIFESMILLINEGILESSLLYPEVYALEKPEELLEKAKVLYDAGKVEASKAVTVVEKQQSTMKVLVLGVAVVAGSIAIVKLT